MTPNMRGRSRSKANLRPGSAATTRDAVDHENRFLLVPLKRAPTLGPDAPRSHLPPVHSGLHSPMRVMSETSSYTSSGGAAISLEASPLIGCLYLDTGGDGSRPTSPDSKDRFALDPAGEEVGHGRAQGGEVVPIDDAVDAGIEVAHAHEHGEVAQV